MTLVYTCGWIEWLAEGALADSFAPYMQDAADLLVPTTVRYELYKWVNASPVKAPRSIPSPSPTTA